MGEVIWETGARRGACGRSFGRREARGARVGDHLGDGSREGRVWEIIWETGGTSCAYGRGCSARSRLANHRSPITGFGMPPSPIADQRPQDASGVRNEAEEISFRRAVSDSMDIWSVATTRRCRSPRRARWWCDAAHMPAATLVHTHTHTPPKHAKLTSPHQTHHTHTTPARGNRIKCQSSLRLQVACKVAPR